MTFTPTVTDAAVVSLGIWLVWRYLSAKPKLPVPPGPSGYPVIGNLLDMPTKEQPQKFSEMGKEYGTHICFLREHCAITSVIGPLMHLNVLGQPIVVVNDIKIATELLEKRSNIYSDRPSMRMAGEMVGWSNTLALQKYGPSFRSYRRHFFRMFGSRAGLESYNPLFEAAGHNMLKKLLEKPEDWANAYRQCVEINSS
jgi:cytochrome P450